MALASKSRNAFFMGKVVPLIAQLFGRMFPFERQKKSASICRIAKSGNTVSVPKMLGINNSTPVPVADLPPEIIDKLSTVLEGRTSPEDYFTSYPTDEVGLALRFVEEFKGQELAEERQRLLRVGVFKSDFCPDQADKEFQNSLGRLLEDIPEIDPNIEKQIVATLRMELRRKNQDVSNISIASTSPRDVPQSEIGNILPFGMARELFKINLRMAYEEGLLTVQTGGGATLHFTLMSALRGNLPKSFFEYHRRMLRTHALEFARVLRRAKLSAKDPLIAELWDCFRVPEGGNLKEFRKRMADVKVAQILEAAGVDPESSDGIRIRNCYKVRQKVLSRGEFGFALAPLNPYLIYRLTKRMVDCGVDVVQVFDWRNRLINIELGCDAAVRAGALIQPELHGDPLFKGGLLGYKKMAQKLIAKYRKYMFALGVKDAPGLCDRFFKFRLFQLLGKLVKEMRFKQPISSHTHDTNGDRLECELEAARGADGHPVIIDLCGGIGVLAQPNQLKYLGFKYGNKLRDLPVYKLAMQEYRILRDYFVELQEQGDLSPTLSTGERFEIMAGGQAGGANAAFERALRDWIPAFKPVIGEAANGFTLVKSLVRSMMEPINQLIGCVSRVTPAVSWISNQAIVLGVSLVQSGHIEMKAGRLERVENPETVVPEFPLIPPLRNHVVEFLFNPDLAEVCHRPDGSLVEQALKDYNSILDVESIFEQFQGGADAEDLIKLLPEDVFEWVEKLQSNGINCMVLDLLKAIQNSELNLEGLSPPELLKQLGFGKTVVDRVLTEDELDEKYQFGEIDEEDALLQACFSDGDMADHFFKCRAKLIEKLASQELPANERIETIHNLREMGHYA